MAAYVIVEVEVTDPVEYGEYLKLTPATIAQYGGRFIVRGGRTETLEGGWAPPRLVVIEFESAGKAKAWYDSPEYAAAMQIRHRTANSRMLIVEGV